MIRFGSTNRLPPGARAFDFSADGEVEVHGYRPSFPDANRAQDLHEQIEAKMRIPPDPTHLRWRLCSR